MSLEEKLAKIRAASADQIPAEQLAIMHRAVDELRASGIADRVVGPGDPLPPFAAPGSGRRFSNSGPARPPRGR